MVKKLGIMGGSFDPIHKGHLVAAEAMESALGLTQVLFVPAYISPFKLGKGRASGKDRYAMVELAIAGHPSWQATTMELERGGVSYSYDTIVDLRKLYGPEWEFYFLVGADSIWSLDKWYRIKEALELCTFVVATRPGYMAELEGLKTALAKKNLTNILWLQTPALEISSTEVRDKMSHKQSIEEFVPRAIVEYMRQRDLYRQ